MFLRLFIATLFLLVFTSCDFLSPNQTTLQNFAALDTIIDYNTVDVYPIFKACNNCDTNVKNNLCFENEFVKSVEKIINKNKIRVKNEVLDTIFIDILVDNTGKISVSKIQKTSKLIKDIPKFDSIFQQSIAQLPKTIQPSLKRGIPVNAVFKLPVVVSTRK